ncbi:unnamed protein product [Cylicocyclus nassatus]|uniref:Uncharacterized protein n=1 Tax=Cylicocyclus nassatus TaxID=53992 RepID=A0AA36DLU8_CYLNA|nr:unnamed protein product [Cylicocyclus nassatus]
MRQQNSPEKSKLYYINKSDLRNLVVKYKIHPSCRNDDDMTSLHMRSEEQNPEDGIKDKRNLARPFRVRECNAAHRAALKDYENNKKLITNTGSEKWDVEALTSNRTFHVEMKISTAELAEFALISSDVPVEAQREEARDSRDIHQVTSRERRMELWKSAQISYTVVNDKIKRLVKLDTDETMESLTQIVERLQAVEVFAASVENGESGPSMAARPELTRQGAKLHLEPIRVERDPALPPDMDLEEYEAQITEWLRCDNEGCKIWVHSACGRARPNGACTYCKTGHYSPCLE